MDDGYLAEIRIWAGNFAPRSWAFCNGQLLSIATNTALFSLLGTTYGGDGRSTFALPDLRGRVPRGVGTGAGLSPVVLGAREGYERITLSPLQMPAHNHLATANLSIHGEVEVKVNSAEGEEGDPSGNFLAGTNGTGYSDEAGSGNLNGVSNNLQVGGSVITQTAGGSQPFPLIDPVLGLNFIICTQGLFPSRS